MARSEVDEIMLVFIARGMRIERDGSIIGVTGKVLKGNTTGGGYLSINCGRKPPRPGEKNKRDTRWKVKAHRVQAYQKYGDALFEDGIEVRHLNEDKKDNSWENVAIGTRLDNRYDKPQAERQFNSKKRLTDNQVRSMRKLHEDGVALTEIGTRYRRSLTAVWYVVNRKTYKHVE